MAWEIVADFRDRPELTPGDRAWRNLAVGLALKLREVEPRLRFVLKQLPDGVNADGTIRGNFGLLVPPDVPAPLRAHLEPPGGRTQVVRQFFCKTCSTDPAKPVWFPQMWLEKHRGHEFTRSEPTSRVTKPTWTPGYRLLVGAPARLRGLHWNIYSAALTSPPEDATDLRDYDAVLVLPPRVGLSGDAEARLRADLPSAEDVVVLPPDTGGAVTALLAWMKSCDPHSVDDERELTHEEKVERIDKRVIAAATWIDRRRAAGAVASAPGAATPVAGVVTDRAQLPAQLAAQLPGVGKP